MNEKTTVLPSMEEVVAAYVAAWSEAEPEARLDLLLKSWAENGVYSDPTAQVQGRDALNEHLGTFQREFANHELEMLSGIDSHHGRARFEWKLADPDGDTLVAGIDFVVFAGDGRLQSVTGFFGPSPPVSS